VEESRTVMSVLMIAGPFALQAAQAAADHRGLFEPQHRQGDARGSPAVDHHRGHHRTVRSVAALAAQSFDAPPSR
jgi:Ni/Co efflux regulator RcnB